MKRVIEMFVMGFVFAGGVAFADMGTASPPFDTPSGSIAGDHNREGIEHYHQRRWGVAMAHFMEALKVDPKSAEAHYNLALTMDKIEEHKVAAEHFKHAFDLGKDNTQIQNSDILKNHLKTGKPRMGY